MKVKHSTAPAKVLLTCLIIQEWDGALFDVVVGQRLLCETGKPEI